MDLVQVLHNAQNPDQNIRSAAEMQLNAAVEADYGKFLLLLCVEFATEGKDLQNRQLAGLFIKNLIAALDENLKEQKEQKWQQCEPATKDQIRQGFLQAIQTPQRIIARTAAQILAAYGAVDVPSNSWPNLLQTLCHNITSPEAPDNVRHASIETLGFMCDEMNPDDVSAETVNIILSAIVDGLRNDRPDEIKEAAITALNNSLYFASKNFEMENERNAIMLAICETTQNQSVEIRAKGYECFVTVAEKYYEKLGPYVETIYKLSLNCIKTDDARVAVQAIDYWQAIASYEYSAILDLEEDPKTPVFNMGIIEKLCKELVPVMLENMSKQVDEDGDDDWTVDKAAAYCLQHIALTVREAVVPLVAPFVEANIGNQDWHLKEAAIMAFGEILEGPDPQILENYVIQAVGVLAPCVKDPTALVRDTSVYTIGRICQFHKSSLVKSNDNRVLTLIVQAIVEALEDPNPSVIDKACFAIHCLAAACEDESENNTNILSPFMKFVIEKLLVVATSTNPDVKKSSACEAIGMIVTNSAKDMKATLVMLLENLLMRLEQTFNQQMNDRSSIQSSFCVVIGDIIKKLSLEELQNYADTIMKLLIQLLSSNRSVAHEDSMLVVGAMYQILGPHSNRYATHLNPYIINCLRQQDDAQLVTMSVLAVGDLCRSIGKEVSPYCDEIMNILVELLQSDVVDRSVKPHVISLFSDIALAIEKSFDKYIVVMDILTKAGEVTTNSDDEEMIEYIIELRSAILEAYSGILLGLFDPKEQVPSNENVFVRVQQQLSSIMEFIRRCIQDENINDDILKSCIALVGDLVGIFKKNTIPFKGFIMEVLKMGYQSAELEITRHTESQVRKYLH